MVIRDDAWAHVPAAEWDATKARIAELEAAMNRIRRIMPEGLTKSAADAFYECQQIADGAMNPKR